jgi:hypothetical protein
MKQIANTVGKKINNGWNVENLIRASDGYVEEKTRSGKARIHHGFALEHQAATGFGREPRDGKTPR